MSLGTLLGWALCCGFSQCCPCGRLRTSRLCFRRQGTLHIVEMRRRDMQCHAVLTIQSWRRGRPRPTLCSGSCRGKGDAGGCHENGCRPSRWAHILGPVSSSNGCQQQLHALTVFFERIGKQVTLHRSLDGQELLPYQCTILREDSDRVRERFHRA
ncbi:unnamed protein product [Symbiodinium necroappetens]|uniref:Secreted protein n=1 Tax=Symbiodinium necroappetens TaxID=1628268 RepID=A0A813AVJ2_9DINO|nr:unnamed protein product [Symbiodinium necroappetens]